MKDELGRFSQNRLPGRHDPIHLNHQFTAVLATLRSDNATVDDGTHFVPRVGREGDRVIPEVDAVYIAVVKHSPA